MANRIKPRTVKIWTSRPRPARLLDEGPTITSATVTPPAGTPDPVKR